MRTLALCISTSFYSCIVLAQDVPGGSKHNQERLMDLRDNLIRNEIASFSINGASIRGSGSLSNTLMEIPLKKCSDKHLYFEKGNLYAAEIIVSIQASEGALPKGIKNIMYIHYKYGFCLPDSAIVDIPNPKFCEKYTSKGKPLASNSRVFRSADKKRVYIYMLNGEGTDSYEVTWVVQDSQYLTRVVDHVGDRPSTPSLSSKDPF